MKLFLYIQNVILFTLLFCYPRSYRLTYGPEIYRISKHLLQEAADQGWATLMTASLREIWGLVHGLIQEYTTRFGALQPIQRAALRAIIAYLLLLFGLALALQYASRAEQQVITVLQIGETSRDLTTVRISGKRLDCMPSDKAIYTERCTIPIAEQNLILYAKRNPPDDPIQVGGSCEAWYANQQWPCIMGLFYMNQRAALLTGGLGLSDEHIRQLRWKYPVENIGEDRIFIGLIFVLPILTALILSILLLLFRWSPERKVGVLGVIKIALFCLVIWIGTCISFGLLSSSFWD